MKKAIFYLILLCAMFSHGIAYAKSPSHKLGPKCLKNIVKRLIAYAYVQYENPIPVKIEGTIARRGCCSWHQGVCGCDEAQDRIVCCDGTLSPSCTCSGY